MEFLIFGVYLAIVSNYRNIGKFMEHFSNAISRYDIEYRLRNFDLLPLDEEEILWLISTIMIVVSVIVLICQIKRRDSISRKIESVCYVIVWNFVNSIAAASMVIDNRAPLLAALKNSVSIRIADVAWSILEPILELFGDVMYVMADELDIADIAIISIPFVLSFWIYVFISTVRTVVKPSRVLSDYGKALKVTVYAQRLVSILPVLLALSAVIVYR